MRNSLRRIHFISVDFFDGNTCVVVFRRDEYGVSAGTERIIL
jgi:hypothetical protein